MHEFWLFGSFYSLTLFIPVVFYVRRQMRRDREARQAAAQGQIYSDGPRGQHPHIDVSHCIGCQGCTAVCPEGQVLGMVGGKAAVIRPHRCIGHSLCAEACPVGAITLVNSSASLSASLPYLSEDLETSVPNLFIAGELGGLALIRNAVRQGREAIDTIAARLAEQSPAAKSDSAPELFDVVIVGAGPAGISASLRAAERGLKYVTIEREDVGGTILKYPRQKLVMTSVLEFPLCEPLRKKQISKEFLLDFWKGIASRKEFHARVNETVEDIRRGEDGVFTVRSHVSEYRGRAVLLAMGRSGIPRKLGVRGEDLPKIMYRLIEADHYTNDAILVVGGGDSAVEAAMGLGIQKGNKVTLSYRGESFRRIKERNAMRLNDAIRSGSVQVLYQSTPVEFTESGVILDVGGEHREIKNDFAWIFAGGVAPDDFLRKIGISFGTKDVTAEVVQEAVAAL